MAGRPNDAIFGTASQTRTANEIAKQPGDYKCEHPATGTKPPPINPTPFGALKDR